MKEKEQLFIKLVNASTGEEIEREMNFEEYEAFFEDKEKAELERLAKEQAAADKQALKDSANSKLAALGLTPEEIAAITGA
jgi:hypothetical protein